MRGVTRFGDVEKLRIRAFQPALPMRGVTVLLARRFIFRMISTRTPHAGSDHVPRDLFLVVDDFNPHSPCGE